MIDSKLVIWIVSMIFGAGAAWGAFKTLRKDVNAIGQIQRRDRWNLMIAMLVITEKREDRQRLADLMRQQ
jgi:hypothetical protein